MPRVIYSPQAEDDLARLAGERSLEPPASARSARPATAAIEWYSAPPLQLESRINTLKTPTTPAERRATISPALPVNAPSSRRPVQGRPVPQRRQ